MEIFRKKDIPWRIIDGKALLVNPKTSLLYPLNETGARIWELLDGKIETNSIAAVIMDEFDVNKDEARRDVQEFVNSLTEAGLAQKL